MPGIYASRASKFLYIDGNRFTGPDAPLTNSEVETEIMTEKYMPEGSARPVVVNAGLLNDMITLEGFARRDTGAANLVLETDAQNTAATPERLVTIGDFGDTVGQLATLHRGMRLTDGWRTIPGDVLLQFAGTLRDGRGDAADVQEGTIIRTMSQTVGQNDTTPIADFRGRLVDLGAASTDGFVIGYQVEEIEFKDRATVTLGVSHSASRTTGPTTLPQADVTLNTTGANDVQGPFGFWRVTTGSALQFVAPRFVFGGAGTATDTSVTFHCIVARL